MEEKQMCKYEMGDNWLGNSATKVYLMISVDQRLQMSQQ